MRRGAGLSRIAFGEYHARHVKNAAERTSQRSVLARARSTQGCESKRAKWTDYEVIVAQVRTSA